MRTAAVDFYLHLLHERKVCITEIVITGHKRLVINVKLESGAYGQADNINKDLNQELRF